MVQEVIIMIEALRHSIELANQRIDLTNKVVRYLEDKVVALEKKIKDMEEVPDFLQEKQMDDAREEAHEQKIRSKEYQIDSMKDK